MARIFAVSLILATALASQALAQPTARLAALRAELAAHDSATAVLQAICDRHSPGLKITARQTGAPATPVEEARARADLGVGPAEPLRYRQVELACGPEVLSRAQNWYLPARLTPEMNRTLDETRTPFGVAVAALNFKRRTLASEALLPRSAKAPPPPEVLRNRAVLITPDGRAFSLVVETYTDRALAVSQGS